MSYPNNHGGGNGYGGFDRRYSNGHPPPPHQPQPQPPPPSPIYPSYSSYPESTQHQYHHGQQQYYGAPILPPLHSPRVMLPQQTYQMQQVPQMQQMQQHNHHQHQHQHHQQGQYNAPILPHLPPPPPSPHNQQMYYQPPQPPQPPPPQSPVSRYPPQIQHVHQQYQYPPQPIPNYTTQQSQYTPPSTAYHYPLKQREPQAQPRVPAVSPVIKSEGVVEMKQEHTTTHIPKETYSKPIPPLQSTPSISQYDGALPAVSSPMRPMTTKSSRVQESHPSILNSRSLIALAEEFFAEAHKLAATLSVQLDSTSINTYQKLIATGLGCLETCLLNLDLKPRLQARIRLRMAAVMFQETENLMETESCLSKGIKLCEQHKFFDLQYSMMFLQSRVLFKTSPKTVLKQLDIAITNAELYRHHSWVYALRFLRVELSFQTDSASIRNTAIQHLQVIATLSMDRGDRSVHAASALIEAIAHLSSPGTDNLEHANRALASARTYQLDQGNKIPQLVFLTHCLDVVCSFLHTPRGETPKKLRALQLFMDSVRDDKSWNPADGALAIPVNTHSDFSQTASPDSGAVLGVTSNGHHFLVLSCLGKQDAMAFSNLLSGIVQMQNKDHEKNKASQYLDQTNVIFSNQKRLDRVPMPLPIMLRSVQWRSSIAAYAFVHQAFCLAIRTQWDNVLKVLHEVEKLLPLISERSKLLQLFCLYLTGIHQQGTGQLDAALVTFADEGLTVAPAERSTLDPESRVRQDLCILALMNRIWIMQSPNHSDVLAVSEYIDSIEPYIKSHPDNEIKTAFDILKATIETSPPTSQVQQKNYLKPALTGANASGNAQFMSIVFNIMCMKFFDGVVGEQAHKSAQAAAVWSNKAQNKLWMSVSEGLMASNYEANGRLEEAELSKQRGATLANEAFGQK